MILSLTLSGCIAATAEKPINDCVNPRFEGDYLDKDKVWLSRRYFEESLIYMRCLENKF